MRCTGGFHCSLDHPQIVVGILRNCPIIISECSSFRALTTQLILRVALLAPNPICKMNSQSCTQTRTHTHTTITRCANNFNDLRESCHLVRLSDVRIEKSCTTHTYTSTHTCTLAHMICDHSEIRARIRFGCFVHVTKHFVSMPTHTHIPTSSANNFRAVVQLCVCLCHVQCQTWNSQRALVHPNHTHSQAIE